MTLDFQPVQIPLASGLNQKGDPRAGNPPTLDVCRNVQFDEIGGLQLRKPYDDLGIAIFGGGNLADCRRIVENGNELLCFTKDSLYSWNASISMWVLKGTHVACKVEEESKFVTTGDQIDCDRAELNGTIIYVWADGTDIYVAATDKTTGSTLMDPLRLAASRPRLVALATVIQLFVKDSVGNLSVYTIDPASPRTSLLLGVTVALAVGTFNAYYDVVRQAGADASFIAARRITTTSYSVGTVAATGVATLSTKALTCDGPIAVASHPAGTHVQVVRAHGTNVEGDLITSALVDVYTAQPIGTFTTTCHQIAAAFRTVQTSGTYRCYVFWSADEAGSMPIDPPKSNWVSSTNTLGTQAAFPMTGASTFGVATRAFDINGSVYVGLWFCGSGNALFTRIALQNTYFLFRDDALLVAKMVTDRAAGHGLVGGGYTSTICRLPGVTITSGATVVSFCANERRLLQLGSGNQGYSARAPRDITLTFDSNEARRTARLGETLYISGGEILQYDGRGLYEVGFHTYAWYLENFSLTGGMAIPDGAYTYKSGYRWDNAKGERERSTTATYHAVALTGGPNKVTGDVLGARATHKTTAGSLPAIEVWRTAISPQPDSPFYLVTSVDPAVTGVNGYLLNTDGTFVDNLTDAALLKLEANPENGSVLESLAPPAATIIIGTHDRLFLAGIAGNPSQIVYSKQRSPGEIASFNDALATSIPPEGGAITALAFQEETLVAFTTTAIYALPGDGLDNLGINGQNFGPARIISTDVGAISHETVARTPLGLIFKSNKGWYLLRGWEPQYIGGPVCDFDSDTVTAVHVMESQHQVRCLSKDVSLQGQGQGDPIENAVARVLVWDYLVNQWSEWTIADGVHACIWQGAYAYVSEDDGPKTEQLYYDSVDAYGIDIETAWIKVNDLQGRGRVRWLTVLGEYIAAHRLRIRVARDYEYTSPGVADFFDDEYWTATPTVEGGPLQVRVGPSRQQCQAIKIRITSAAIGSNVPPSNEALKLTGLALEVGVKRGTNRRLPAAQKAS